jgi:hypothetical protein
MNSTRPEQERSAELAGELFDELLVPLARARRETGAVPYFPAWRDAGESSYFARSSVGVMSAADFRVPGGGSPEGLIAALSAAWREQGELQLASAEPRLVAIAHALREEASNDDGNVDIFCYTLF